MCACASGLDLASCWSLVSWTSGGPLWVYIPMIMLLMLETYQIFDLIIKAENLVSLILNYDFMIVLGAQQISNISPQFINITKNIAY